MVIPYWFDDKVYFSNKLTTLGNSHNEVTLTAAFQAAGYAHTPEGLYQHFLDYGNAENVSPNTWFAVDEYLQGKAASHYGTSTVTAEQTASMLTAISNAGMSAWEHFNRYWAEYYNDADPTTGDFLNPSKRFDAVNYMEEKLNAMQRTEPEYSMDMLVAAFQEAGLNPLTHYMAYGKAEGLMVRPVHDGYTGDGLEHETDSAGNDTLVVDGVFGNDIVTNLDPSSENSFNATGLKVEHKDFYALPVDNTLAHYGLDGQILTSAGNTLVMVENAAPGAAGDYWVFVVNSTDTTIDVNDSVQLLGTLHTGANGTFALGDIVI